MRILKFIVNKQRITYNPNSNFNGLTPRSCKDLIADFSFSSEWDDTIKVVAFYNMHGECPPQELIDGMYCRVPIEASNSHWFRVQVIGNKNGKLIKTNMLDVIQNGGN